MADWRPLNLSPDGRRTDVLFDADGKVIFRTQQECDPVLDLNKIARDHDPRRGWDTGGDMRRVASIPLTIIHKWLAEENLDVFSGDEQDRLAKKLNDPDYFYLRTSEGRLGPVGNGAYR